MIEDMTVTEILTLRENLLSEVSKAVAKILLNEFKQRHLAKKEAVEASLEKLCDVAE